MNQKKKIQKRTVVAIWSGLIFVIIWGLYANTLMHSFAFDDKSLVIENSYLKKNVSLKTLFFSTYRAGSGFTGDGLYRPLVMLSYKINATDEMSPFPFHLFNVTFNALNASLLFLLIFILFGNIPLAIFTALIFGFHPVHTEAVANIAGRPEILYVFFLFISWIVLERYGSRFWSLTFASALLFAALFSKETAVIFPFLLIAGDIIKKRPLLSGKSAVKYGIIVLTIILYLVLRMMIFGNIAPALDPDFVDNPIAHSQIYERIATASAVFFRYILIMIFPVKLSSDYSYHQIPIYQTFLKIPPAAGILILIAIPVIAVYYRKRYPVLSLAGAFFLIPFLIVSNIIFPIGTIMGERLLYLPAAGFALSVGFPLTRVYLCRKKTITAVLSLLLMLYAMRTVTRNLDWYDNYSLFSADVHNSPQSVKVLCNLGYLTGKNANESMEYFRRAIEILPEYSDALKGYGKRLYDQKRFEESSEYYARAVNVSPGDPDSHIDYAIVLEKTGRLEEAEKELLISINLMPDNPTPYLEMSTIMIARENYTASLEYLKRASSLGGNKRIILNNTAVAQFLSGDVSAAHKTLSLAESLGISIHEDLARAIRTGAGPR